jgi:hypothetical protein
VCKACTPFFNQPPWNHNGGPIDPEVYAINKREERELEAARFDRVIELEQVIATRSVARLADHLRQAEAAHHEYEVAIHPHVDPDWPTWYASYLLGVK